MLVLAVLIGGMYPHVRIRVPMNRPLVTGGGARKGGGLVKASSMPEDVILRARTVAVHAILGYWGQVGEVEVKQRIVGVQVHVIVDGRRWAARRGGGGW